VLLTFIAIYVNGQQRYNHGLFWFRLAIADTINSQFKWEIYLQKRTQTSSPDNNNIFATPQFKSAWLWFHYTINPRIKVSVSPLGYFESYVLNTKPADANLAPIKEFRLSARIEHESKGKLNFSNRYNLEYRLRDLQNNGKYLPNWRIRYMAKLEKPIKGLLSEKKPVTFTLYDEVFLQFGESVKNNPNVFDQNRVYFGASYEVIRNIKVSLGYIYGFQERNSGKEFDNINTFWTVLTLDNFISQFLHHKSIALNSK
jgi:Protein of unknown function (DUF2490)